MHRARGVVERVNICTDTGGIGRVDSEPILLEVPRNRLYIQQRGTFGGCAEAMGLRRVALARRAACILHNC